MQIRFERKGTCSECWEDTLPNSTDVFLAREGHIDEATVPCIYIRERPLCAKCLVYALAQLVLADNRFFGGMNPSDALQTLAREYDPKPPRGKKSEIALKREQFSSKYKGRRRREILEKYAYRCVTCNDYKDLHIDHIVPLAKGGSNDEDNLQVLCARCNLSKGSKV